MTTELLQKYLDRNCTPAERREAEQWLHSCAGKELDNVMLEIWSDKNNPPMPAEQTQELWKKLSGNTNQQKPASKFFDGRKLIAAAVMAFVVISIVWIFEKNSSHSAVSTTTEQKQVDNSENSYWATVTNTSAEQKTVALNDGSEVLLFPNSSLKYPVQFEKNSRDISLTGKAIFIVAKNKNSPFTVYSHDIATTALGTKFMVDESDKNYTSVKLFEGKIAVKPNEQNVEQWEKILLPGDVFTYDVNKRAIEVKRYASANKSLINKRSANKNEELNFTNAELADVFEVLKYRYKNEIIYDHKDIKGMYFTGIISPTSSLETVLKVIAQMNGLRINKQNGKYILQKNYNAI